MENNKALKNGRFSLTTLWRLALALTGIVAVAQELRKPAEERTWHGKVADFVPYDFRKPTGERFKSAYWNPGGPLFSSKVWGVGWAFNFAGLKKLTGG
ncbi:hypothetical protein BH23ACT4_BH23ACT4_07950 [soil metagenome]